MKAFTLTLTLALTLIATTSNAFECQRKYSKHGNSNLRDYQKNIYATTVNDYGDSGDNIRLLREVKRKQ